jgi:hypothetical protein
MNVSCFPYDHTNVGLYKIQVVKNKKFGVFMLYVVIIHPVCVITLF